MRNSIKNIFFYSISFLIVVIIVLFIVKETNQQKTSNENTSTAYSYEGQNGITIIGDSAVESSQDMYEINSINDMELEEETVASKSNDIEFVITYYFDAICTCDVEKIKSIVDSNEKISEEVLKQKAEYIETYTNFTYYLKKGLVDHTYIVYVVYEVKFKEISVMAPAIERFYIKENSDGVMYISRIPLNGTSANYINKIERQEEVISLKRNVEKRYKDACASEEKLVALEDVMKASIWVKE